MIVNVTLQSVAYLMIVINNSKTFIVQATALVQPIYSENYLLSNSNNKTIHFITQHFVIVVVATAICGACIFVACFFQIFQWNSYLCIILT